MRRETAGVMTWRIMVDVSTRVGSAMREADALTMARRLPMVRACPHCTLLDTTVYIVKTHGSHRSSLYINIIGINIRVVHAKD